MKRVVIAVAAVLLGLGGYAAWFSRQRIHNFGNKNVSYEVVNTEATRQRGLSGRTSLPVDRAMLFVFDTPGEQCFWMKDMRFDLDMIWLDKGKKVVHIERAVTPSSYPASFCADMAAKYVIEVNAGMAQQAGVHVGSQLSF